MSQKNIIVRKAQDNFEESLHIVQQNLDHTFFSRSDIFIKKNMNN